MAIDLADLEPVPDAQLNWGDFEAVPEGFKDLSANQPLKLNPEAGKVPAGASLTTYGGPRAPLASYRETMVAADTDASESPFRTLLPQVTPTTPRVELPKPEVQKDDSFWSAAGKEVVRSIESVPEFFTSDAGIASLVAAKVSPRLTSAAFSADLTTSALSQAKQTYSNWDKMTPAQKGAALVDIAGALIMGGMAAKHATAAGPDFPRASSGLPQGPMAAGELLKTPAGAPAPRAEPTPGIETVSPGEALTRAQQMTKEATLSGVESLPRLPKATVPEGPEEAEPAPVEAPSAPREIATWDDAVAELQRRGKGTETRAQVKSLFPGLKLDNETAKRLATDAFGDQWKPGGQERQPAPAAPVTQFSKALESPDFKGGNDLSTAAGMGAQSVQDLDTLAALRDRYNKEQADILKKAQAMPAGPERDATIQAVLPIGQKAQLAREAIEVATNTGSWVEGEGMGESKTALGNRPLDWQGNKQAADWLRQHGERMAITLPDELAKAPEAPASPQASPAPAAPPAPAPALPAAEWMGKPLEYWKGLTAENLGPSSLRTRLAKSLGVKDEPKAVADKLKARISEIEESAKNPRVVRDVQPGSVSPESIVPAVRLVGGEVVPGEPGETHGDIIKKEEIPAEDLDQRGFSDPEGEKVFLDREAAAKGTGTEAHFEPGTPGQQAPRLHSTDLNREAEARPIPTIEQARADKLPFKAKGAIVEYDVNQKIIDTGIYPTGKKAKPKDIAELKARQEQVVRNFNDAAKGGEKPAAAPTPEPAPVAPAAAPSEPKTHLFDVPRSKGLRGERAQIVRMLERLEDVDERGNPVPREGLTESQEERIKPLRERLSQIERAIQGEASGETLEPVPATKAPVAATKPATPATPDPSNVVGDPAGKNMPEWLRQEMVSRGLDPSRPLNDIDIQDPKVREAIKADPTLTPDQKTALLKTGSAKEIPKGNGSPEPGDLTEAVPMPPKGAPADTMRDYRDRMAARLDAVDSRIEAIDKERDEIFDRRRKGFKDANQANTLEKRNTAIIEEKAGLTMAKNRLELQIKDVDGALSIARMNEEAAPFRGKPVVATQQIPNKVLKAQKDNLLAQVAEAIKAAPEEPTGKITISVPGDGEFTLDNGKAPLKRFREVAAKQFPSSAGGSGMPTIPSGKGKSPPKVSEPKAEDLLKVGTGTVSTDPARFVIRYSYADGTQIVSTDGRQLLRVVTDKAPGRPTEPVRINDEGKIVEPGSKEGSEAYTGRFPNWQVVTPTDPTLVMGGADTGQLYHILRQAEVFTDTSPKDKRGTPAITLFVNPDKSLGARLEVLGDSFEHNFRPDGKSIGSYNPDYLINAVEAARRLGNEKVDLLLSDDNAPIHVRGKNSEHVIMPLKSDHTVKGDPKGASQFAGKALHRPLPKGYGPLESPESVQLAYPTIEGVGKFQVALEAGNITLHENKDQGYSDSKGKKVFRYVPMGSDIPLADWLKADKAERGALIKERLEAAKIGTGSKILGPLEEGIKSTVSDRQKLLDEAAKRKSEPNPKVHLQPSDLKPDPSKSFEMSMGSGLGEFPFGATSPSAASFHNVDLAPLGKVADSIRMLWRRFAMQSLPRITESGREAGEAGARYAAANDVARAKGLQFASQVTEGIKDRKFNAKFGTALTEDNLRDLKRLFQERAEEASDPQEYIDALKEEIGNLAEQAQDGEPDARRQIAQAKREIERISKYTAEDAQAFQDKADGVTSLIGAENSPFPTEEDYQAFLKHPDTQQALTRHRQLWREIKDPLYREANDLDPELDLYTRGLQTQARINLKAVMKGEGTPTTIGPAAKTPLIRQAATVLRKDPFAMPASGSALSYEGSYEELMGNGFAREYPVAKQHEFIRHLVENGDAQISAKEFPDIEIKGEPTKAYLMRLRPWDGQWLQVRRSLAPEYQAVSGLDPSARLGLASSFSDMLTKLSITGFAEGSTHISNLSVEMLSGLGPTSNPMLNALIKSAGRADILWRLPKVLIKGFTNQKAEMLKLAEIGAAKQAYGGTIGTLINAIDQGSRLVAADVYRGMAREGWVPDTETGLREFINSGAGQYNKRLQPRIIRMLRDTGIGPFATAGHTFNVLGLRQMALGPGAKATSNAAALALRADKAGGVVGFIVLLAALNKVISGSSTGPQGTQLGNVGWVGDDKKLHQFPAARLFGFERGARITGLLPFVEAQRNGLGVNTGIGRAAQAVAGTALSYVTGPSVQFVTKALTGKRPGVPMSQEAKVVPPSDDLSPLKSQAAQNIFTALQQSSPAQDAIISYANGQPLREVLHKQFSRYTPQVGMREETIKALPKIVESGEMQRYTESVSKDARKLPLNQRAAFIRNRLKEDGVKGTRWQQAWNMIERRGTLRYQ